MAITQLGPLPAKLGNAHQWERKAVFYWSQNKTGDLEWSSTESWWNSPQYKRDFKQKQIYFRSLPALKQEQGKTVISVARSNVMPDAFSQIMRKSVANLKKKFIIKFDAEEGLDYGGLSREFFLLISHSLFDPNYGLFQYCTNTNYCCKSVLTLELILSTCSIFALLVAFLDLQFFTIA